MADRTDQLTTSREESTADVDLDGLEDEEWWRDDERTATTSEAGTRTAAGTDADSSGLSDYFSPQVFLLSLLVATAGMFAGGMALPLFGNLVGLFVAAFGVGLLTPGRRYAEVGLAGGIALGVGSLLDYFALAVLGGAVPLVAASGGLGVLLAVLGLYFGRDLRSGLTADL